MGKKTDRGYITMKEWSDEFGGRKAAHGDGIQKGEFKPLAFYCCALSLQPFEDPVATPEGVIFDVTNILPWLKKFKIDPITGKPLTAKDLFPVHFHKNDAGKFHCPITFKEFTDYSHIVAIRPSGHVYSYEAIDELNIKTKNMKDLLTDTPFTKLDIITIQDPKNMERRNLSNFHYIKTGLKLADDTNDPLNNIQISESHKHLIRQLNEKHAQQQEDNKEKQKQQEEEDLKAGLYTYVSAEAPGFTSSVQTDSKIRMDSRLVVKKTDKKGYVRLHTNLGDLNLELHCDLVSKTCENFLGLCERGYYNGTIFHRIIPGFMIQGGDPTGTGKGGESLWGNKSFLDEFSPRLQHSARGILSMANSGKDTNKSQFFITFGACSHLNFKHTVFGKVVGGMDTLIKMEETSTDEHDRPLKEVKILKVTIFVNPYKEDKEEEEKRLKEQMEKDKEDKKLGQWYSNPAAISLPKPAKSGVGKYISSPLPSPSTSTSSSTSISTTTSTSPLSSASAAGTKRSLSNVNNSQEESSVRPAKKTDYGDFSKW